MGVLVQQGLPVHLAPLDHMDQLDPLEEQEQLVHLDVMEQPVFLA